jgi:hypothetical protein
VNKMAQRLLARKATRLQNRSAQCLLDIGVRQRYCLAGWVVGLRCHLQDDPGDAATIEQTMSGLRPMLRRSRERTLANRSSQGCQC